MYELIQVTPTCYYVQSPAKIGIVRCGEHEVCLIDSGNDKDAAKKVRKRLDANGWQLRCILNTHSHADHIGGNRYWQEQTGCDIFAQGIEVRLNLLLALHRVGIDQELTTELSVGCLGCACYRLITIVCHSVSLYSLLDR